VSAYLAPRLDLSAAARRVIGRLARFPWVWDRLDEELQDFHAKKAHGQIRVELGQCLLTATSAESKSRSSGRSGRGEQIATR